MNAFIPVLEPPLTTLTDPYLCHFTGQLVTGILPSYDILKAVAHLNGPIDIAVVARHTYVIH